jgi:large subunit ribosomal protein L10
MLKAEKERIVAELVERLRTADTLLVADYRGLSMPEIDDVRTKLLETGARFSVVKNTLTRIAAETAGVKDLLDLLEGPTAIAFLDPEGDPVAAAKVLNEVARTTRVLAIRGGLMEGRTITEDDIKELATLPPVEVLRGQVLAAIIAPLTAIMGLVTAPLQNLHGLIDARIEQLGGEGQTEAPAAEEAPEAPAAEAEAPVEEAVEAPAAEAEAPAAEAEAPAEEPAAAEEPQSDAEAEAAPEASAEAEDTSAGEDEAPAAAEEEEG